MRHLPLIVGVAAITFASRYFFFVPSRSIRLGHFLEVFPVALFVAIGAQNLMSSGGEAAPPNMAAFVGAAVGGFLFRRSMLGVVLTGLAFYWAVRLLL